MGRKLSKALVWVLLIVSFMVGTSLAMPDSSRGALLAESAAPSPAASAPASTSVVTAKPVQNPGDLLYKYEADSADGQAADPGRPLELLPAWRWNSSTALTDDYSWSDAVNANFNGVAVAALGVGQLAWSLTLSLMNMAMTTDLVSGVAHMINKVFYQLASGFWSSGIIVIVFLLVMIAGARMLLKGKLTGALAMGLMFLIPVAFLQFATTKISESTSGTPVSADDKNLPIPAWSPAWIALKGSSIVNTVGEGILMDLANKVGTGGKGYTTMEAYSDTEAGISNAVDCRQYISALNLQYLNHRGSDVRTTSQNPYASVRANPKLGQTTLQDTPGTLSMMMVSDSWVRSFLTNFSTANYGVTDIGMSVVCKQLEVARRVPVTEGYAIVGGTLSSDLKVASRPAASFPILHPVAGMGTSTPNGFAGWGPRPFDLTWGDFIKKGAEQVFVWNACSQSYGTALAPGWRNLQGDQKITDADCARWSRSELHSTTANDDANAVPAYLFGEAGATGEGAGAPAATDGSIPDYDNPLIGTKPDEVYGATTPGPGISPTESQQLLDVGTSITSFWGLNVANRIVNSLLAMMSGVLYLVAFGGLSLGVILAQIGLVLLLAILPVTLILIALPSEKRGSNPGMRMLKMTGGMMMSKLVLTVTITLMVILTGVLGTMANYVNSAIAPFAPLIAFIVLRKIYQQAGLGDVLSPGGALGMATRGGLQSTTGRKGSDSVMGKAKDESLLAKGKRHARALESRHHRHAVRSNAEKQLEASKAGKTALGAGTLAAAGAAGAAGLPAGATDAEKKANSAANQRKTQEALNKAARGDTAALATLTASGALLNGKSVPDALGKLSAVGTIKDPLAAKSLLDASRSGGQASGIEGYQRHRAVMDELAALGIDELAAAQGLNNPLTLSEAAKAERIEAAAAAAGVDRSLISQDALPLAAMVNTGAVEGMLDERLFVYKQDGSIDYEATRARVTAQAALSVETVASISEVSHDLHSKFGEMFSMEDCQRAVTHSVLHDAGLSTSVGVTVDPFVAAGMSENEIKLALDGMLAGKPCEQLVKLAVDYDARSAVLQDGWQGSIAASAENVLSRIQTTPIQVVAQVNAPLMAATDVINSKVGRIDALVAGLPGLSGVEYQNAVQNIVVEMGDIPSQLADARRAQVVATANVEVSRARLNGLADDSAIYSEADIKLAGVAGQEQSWVQRTAGGSAAILADEDPGAIWSQLKSELAGIQRQFYSEAESTLQLARQVQDDLSQRTPRVERKPSPMPSA